MCVCVCVCILYIYVCVGVCLCYKSISTYICTPIYLYRLPKTGNSTSRNSVICFLFLSLMMSCFALLSFVMTWYLTSTNLLEAKMYTKWTKINTYMLGFTVTMSSVLDAPVEAKKFNENKRQENTRRSKQKEVLPYSLGSIFEICSALRVMNSPLFPLR